MHLTPHKTNLTRPYYVIQFERKFECEECVNEFSVQSKLTEHQKSVHIGIRDQCEQCDSLPKMF